MKFHRSASVAIGAIVPASSTLGFCQSPRYILKANPFRVKLRRNQLFKRTRYHGGCLTRERRKTGPAVWIFRWRDAEKVQRKLLVGTVEEYRTKAAALKAVEHLRVTINNEIRSPRTVAELTAHYAEKELSEGSAKPYSTRHVYGSHQRNWIRPHWGERSLSSVKSDRSRGMARQSRSRERNKGKDSEHHECAFQSRNAA